MFGYGWCSDMGVAGWLLMIGFWAGFLALVVWAVSRLFPSSNEMERPGADELLDRRFAAGEIDADTYQRARDAMSREPVKH